jgi:hypothetical protein
MLREAPAFRPGRKGAQPIGFASGYKNRCNVCMKRTHVFLPEPVIAALRTLSEKTGLSVAEHIRRAIDEYLKRQ